MVTSNMIINDQNIEVKVWSTNNKHFKSLGYDCKQGDKLIVSVRELQNTSPIKIRVLCDYCLSKNIKNEILKRYDVALNDEIINKKHSCLKCRYDKVKETCIDKYGVEYAWQSENTKEKSRKTNLEKYGVENVMHNEEIKTKLSKVRLKQCMRKILVPNQNNKNL